jgi:hypothetical protein
VLAFLLVASHETDGRDDPGMDLPPMPTGKTSSWLAGQERVPAMAPAEQGEAGRGWQLIQGLRQL